MSTKKAISTSFVAIFILIITQIIAQSIASMFVTKKFQLAFVILPLELYMLD